MGSSWRIEVRAASVRYGDRVVLSPCDLNVFSAGSTAVVGPSGSGKTTLLSLLGALRLPSSGSVRVLDPDGAERQLRSHVAWVLQTTNAMGRRTVMENVLLGSLLSLESNDYRREAASRAIEAMGLGLVKGSPARHLSGGEAQRLSMARAVVAERLFILADEPTGQLDSETTDQVLNVLFADTKRALVIATHDPRVWERCDRVLKMDELQCQ